MTLLQIEYFVEVCRAGSTLQAAQKLNVSQSTVSASIRNLEEELGVPLFARTSKGMTPTQAGGVFLERGQEVLDKVADVRREMERFAAVRRPVRFGIPVQLNQMYWSDLYFELKQAFPEWQFQAVNRTTPVLLEMLRRNELDGVIFLASVQQVPEPSLVLRREKNRYVSMSVRHPLAGEKSVSYRQLADCPVLRYAGDDLKFQLLEATYREMGLPRPAGPQFDQLSTLLQFLRKNAGIAYLHRSITRDYPDLVSLPIEEEAGRTYVTYLSWSPCGLLAHAPRRLFQVIQNYFARL